LAAGIKDKQRCEQQAKEAATRKSLIGSGDRSERIRTYNFPQGRVTDHRIGLTLYKINDIMDGDLSQLTQALLAEHQTEQLAAFAKSNKSQRERSRNRRHDRQPAERVRAAAGRSPVAAALAP